MTNVLLVVLDTARADALEPYGAAAGASPAIADLARRGTALESVHSTACWTLPSHVSLLTGMLPREAGLAQAPGGKPPGVAPVLASLRDRYLPSVLHGHGYDTRGVSANVWVSERGGFSTGFDEFVNPVHNRQEALGRRSRIKGAAAARAALTAARGRGDDGAAAAGEVVERWVREWSGKPFFWFVNLMECHSPYAPPRPYGDVSTLDRVRSSREARRFLNLGAISRACLGGLDVPPDVLDRMRRLYAGAVRYLDDWVGRILEAMDARALLDDTLVIVTSDHGENFGEGGLVGHAFSLDERLTRVPFVAAGPGAPESLRSLAEVPAAIASALDLRFDPWRSRSLPPCAVAQFDVPGDASDPRVQQSIAEWGLDEENAARMVTPLTTATDGRLKLQRRGTVEELFDLAADPLELSPQPAARPGVDALRAALDHHAATAVPSSSPANAVPAAASDSEVADLEERMRVLGYL